VTVDVGECPPCVDCVELVDKIDALATAVAQVQEEEVPAASGAPVPWCIIIVVFVVGAMAVMLGLFISSLVGRGRQRKL
jgi:hypothetical protein